jgi:hypothetical protein
MKKSIKMLQTTDGHDETETGQGLPLKTYLQGEVYLVSESLYNCFKAMKVCEDEEKVKEPKPSSETKDAAKPKAKDKAK